MVPKNPKPSTPQKTVALPAHELSKLDRPALGGLLSLSLETFTRRRVEALFESADPAAAAEALARIDADEAERRRAESVEAQFSKLLRPKTRYPLLDPAFVSEYRRELVVTARAIGAYQLSEGHEPHAEHDRSYRFWMGNKLNLSREETEAADLEAVELRFSEKLDAARKHVTDRLLSVPPEIREFFKSAQYFDDLHTVGEERLSPRRLFSLFVEFEHAREAFARHKNHPDAIGELKKAQYEIQRLFALADLYRDYEQTPEYQNLTLDAEFLERKVSSLFERSASADDEVGLPSIRHIRPNNVLYAHTVSKRTYWKNENGTYVFSESPAPGAIPMKLESATFVWKRRTALKFESRVPLRHVEIRSMKDAASAVDKYLRKNLSSFGEIIDQKGMIIVLDSFDSLRLKTLKGLLENELWTGSTSWKEPLEWVANGENAHTKAGYRCLKGVMKVPHKLKSLKASIRSIEETLERLAADGKRASGRKKRDLVQRVRELESLITQFDDQFRDSSYNVALEVQIFDLESYVQAEKDPKSAVNHNAYKHSQTVRKIVPILFPVEIYGEDALRRLLMPEIEEGVS